MPSAASATGEKEPGSKSMSSDREVDQASQTERRRSSRWILGPWRDLLLFVGTPVVVLPLGWLAARQSSGERILFWVLAFGALGHHLPGLLRAYGDRELFRRFRVRFVVVPLILLPTCGLFFLDQLVGMRLVVLAWGVWHFLMQTYGFARIYDAKSGRRNSGWLDWGLCVTWFGAAVLHSPRRVGEFLGMAYQAGLPVSWRVPLADVQAVWDAVTVMLTVLALGGMLWRLVRGEPVSTGKWLLLVISFSFFWYCNVTLTNLVLGIAMFEIFHDVQYLSIVWSFNRRRVESGAGVGGLTRFLFRNSGSMIGVFVGLYVGLVLAYGSLSAIVDGVSSEHLRNLLYGVIATSNLLHFYYDGFIWKVRERGTRHSLGVEANSRPDVDTAAGEDHARPATGGQRLTEWRHWLSWCGLALLAVTLWQTESNRMRDGEVGDLEMARAVVAHVPSSVAARNELARTLINDNQFVEATAQADTAVRLEPDVYKSWVYRGVARIESGKHAAGLTDLLAAERMHAADAYLQYHLAMAKLELGRVSEAEAHLKVSRSLRPGNADVHYNLGVISLQEGMRRSDRRRLEAAVAHFRLAVVRDEGHARAICMLAETDRQLGRPEDAVAGFRRSLALDGDLAAAHHGLSLALREMGEFGNSNASLARAIFVLLTQVRASAGGSMNGEQLADWAEELVERSGREDVRSRELLAFVRATEGNWSAAVELVEAALASPRATSSVVRARLARTRQQFARQQMPDLVEQVVAGEAGGD